jgi:hypothetical protein
MRFPRTIFAIAITFVAFGCTVNQSQDTKILFAPKSYYDTATTTDNLVYIAGTLTGDGVGYPNNSTAISCYRDRMECLTYSVEQIGPNQVSRLDILAPISVTKWDAGEVVASTSSDLPNCRKDTVSIIRKTEAVVWVQEPINQSQAVCKKSETRILKWTIEDPPGWKTITGSK